MVAAFLITFLTLTPALPPVPRAPYEMAEPAIPNPVQNPNQERRKKKHREAKQWPESKCRKFICRTLAELNRRRTVFMM